MFKADVLIVNASEARWLLRSLSKGERESLPAATRLRNSLDIRAVIVTDGANGVTWAPRNESGSVPAVKIKVIDPVGAGDAFCAGVVHALEIQGTNLSDAIKFASSCAALAVSAPGAAEAMPLLSAVTALRARTAMATVR